MSRTLLVALLVPSLATVACAEPSPRPRSAGYVEPTTCIGGLCVRPDNVVAKKVKTSRATRCVITAWDGDASLPPTAKVAVTDDAPARPGVFLTVELAGMMEGFPYRLDEKQGGTTAMAVRVDPGVRFADARIAESGDVVVTRNGEDLLVRVRAVFGGSEHVAWLTVPKTRNGCGAPIKFD